MKREKYQAEPPIWESISPVIDEAVADLKPDYRSAVTLRYFAGKSVCEVGAALGISEWAAQKRIDRAVAKLRSILARHGIQSTQDALIGVLSTNTVAAAPPQLAAKLSLAAVTRAASSSLATKGAVTIMATAKAKLLIAGTIGAILLATAGTVAYRQLAGATPARSATQPSSANWKAQFTKVYALAPRQTAKHVAPPFTPQRNDFFRDAGFGGHGYPDPEEHSLILEDAGGQVLARHAYLAKNGYQLAISSLGIFFQDVDAPASMMDRQVPGDWVF